MNECETDLKTDTENALKKAINKIIILEAKNELLEEQIEKMKCCHNCRKFNNLSYDCTCAEVCNEWEIKEK